MRSLPHHHRMKWNRGAQTRQIQKAVPDDDLIILGRKVSGSQLSTGRALSPHSLLVYIYIYTYIC